MRRHLALAFIATGFAGVANAQITQYTGPSTNFTTALDFDNPFVPTGPIMTNDPVFTAAGITSIDIIGAPTANGDTLTAASNVMGQGLITQNGILSVATAPDPLDNVSAGGGWEIVLASPVDEFQALFIDQAGMNYDIELLMGATSLGIGNFTYPNVFPSPPHFWRAGGQFDTIRITFPTSVGVGIDEFGFGNGPPPPPPPPLPPNCVETVFASNNGGGVGGAVYFDITVTQNVSFAGLLTNTGATGVVGMTVFTTPGTYVGQENNMAAWTQVAEDDGSTLGLGLNMMTPMNFVAPFMLAPGTYGIALMGDNFTTGGQLNHSYTNGTGGNQAAASTDGVISLSLGAATNVPFTGGVFSPRVWNGRMCHGMGSGPGTNYCMANNNSTGVTAAMAASGSANVAANNLVLEAGDMPNNSFGFFLTSLTQGFVANPGGSSGNLCLGGAIGRYVGPGQIQNSMGTGGISLAVDNTMQPSPTGFVMVAAGETWSYQAWFRDTTPGGPATSNFTDGLEITHN